MHCYGMADVMLSQEAEAEQLHGDQVRLPRFEQGEFTVADRDINEVPPYQNNEFMSRVRELAVLTMCVRHKQQTKQLPPSELRDVTGLRGSIPGSASCTTNLAGH